MSPEEWLAQQQGSQPNKSGILSPEEWLATQTPPKQQARVASEDEGDFFRGITNVPGQIQNIYGAGKVLTGLEIGRAHV